MGEDIDVSADKGDNEDDAVGELLCPMVNISSEEHNRLCQPWKKSLMVNLLGKRISLTFLRSRSLKMWKPQGDIKLNTQLNLRTIIFLLVSMMIWKITYSFFVRAIRVCLFVSSLSLSLSLFKYIYIYRIRS